MTFSLKETPPYRSVVPVLSQVPRAKTAPFRRPIMPGKSGANQIRYERIPDHEDESFVSSLSADATDSEFDLEGGGKEHGYYTSGHGRFLKLTHNDPLLLSFSSSQVPSWAKQNRHPLFRRWPRCVRQVGTNSWGNSLYGWRRPRALTLVLKSLAIAFMLL